MKIFNRAWIYCLLILASITVAVTAIAASIFMPVPFLLEKLTITTVLPVLLMGLALGGMMGRLIVKAQIKNIKENMILPPRGWEFWPYFMSFATTLCFLLGENKFLCFDSGCIIELLLAFEGCMIALFGMVIYWAYQWERQNQKPLLIQGWDKSIWGWWRKS